MDNDYEELKKYLRMDNWEVEDAMRLINGCHPAPLEPNTPTTSRYEAPLDSLTLIMTGKRIIGDDLAKLKRRISNTSEIWAKCSHGLPVKEYETENGYLFTEYTAKYFIGWAKEKRIDIPWFDWAIDNGYIDTGEALIEYPDKVGLMSTPDNSKGEIDTPLMKVANRIWTIHYENLSVGDRQPKKEVILASIEEIDPSLKDAQKQAIYRITRRTYGKEII